MRAETPLCLCEKMKETTSRNGSDERFNGGYLLLYMPVSEEYQCWVWVCLFIEVSSSRQFIEWVLGIVAIDVGNRE